MSQGPSELRRRLAARAGDEPPLLLDGAMGTELERRGVAADLPLWSAAALVDAPQQVQAVHHEYVAAGADALTANTFRTQERSLARGQLGTRAAELTRLAVGLARRATAGSGRRISVLGSAPPLEDCYRPDLVAPQSELVREHRAHASNLVGAGVDAILAETHHTIREAVAAVAAARACGAEVLVGFVCGPGARLLSGETLADALAAVAPLAPVAVGVNCLPPDRVTACLPILQGVDLPFFVYANLGAPGPEGGFSRTGANAPEAYARQARSWTEAGAALVGGCCGTTAAYIRAIAEPPSRSRALRRDAGPAPGN